jgi:hypothetical protein
MAPVSPSHEPRFAIEMPGPPVSHVLASEGGGSSAQIPFSSLTEVSWLARRPDGPVTLQLDFSAEGNQARVVSYAIYQSGKKKLGDHRAGLNESVTLTELSDLGYHPLTLRVLPPTPPPRPAPVLLSNAPSLRLDAAKENWDTFTIAVHNLSARGLVAYAIGGVRTARDHSWHETEGTAAHPAIPAGGTDANVELATNPVVLLCALFDDGSWEGDPDFAASFKVRLAASEAMERQIDEVAARALSDPALDDAARVERIRAGIDALSEKLSPELVREALAGVPVRDLTSQQESSLEYALHNIKWHTSDGLAHFKTGGRVTLAQYWALTNSTR